MRACCVLIVAACAIASTEAFFFLGPASARPAMAGVRRRLTCARLSSEPTLVDGMMYDVVADPKEGMPVETPFVVSEFLDALCGDEESPSGWDGYSRPKKLNSLLDLPKEAKAWEVEDDREEVWGGDPNPPTDIDWMTAFGPSEEEIHAAEAGYDFENPEQWQQEMEAFFLDSLRKLLEHKDEWREWRERNPEKSKFFEEKIKAASTELGEDMSDEERDVVTSILGALQEKELAGVE